MAEREHPFIIFLFLVVLFTIGRAILIAIDNAGTLFQSYVLMGILALVVLAGLKLLDII